ncbi:MAG: TonB-dependent receptor [Thalassotalea sp.]
MSNNIINKSTPNFKRTLISSIIAMNVMGASAYAQDETAKSEAAVEVISVTGTFSSNLKSALSDKKLSSTISDGISADDIGSLPALDLGEALQAVPGIQLNREGERRESSVNLRGLPSGFVMTTANGQTIASASRSNKNLGAPNPFGAFDAQIFNGVRVLKTSSADMVEGGISGTIDQKLARALSAKEKSLKVSVGTRYEELNDTYDTETAITGSKHNEDATFGIVGTLAWSEQSFRRDTIKINRYDNMSSRFDSELAGMDYDAYKAANNVPAGATVEMPGELRQISETNFGDRLSFSGGIEWKPTDNFTFGTNVIYTERDMDDNGYQQVDFRPRQGGSLVNPKSAPRNTGTLTSGGDEIWSVADIDVRDVQIAFGSREMDIYTQSQAIVFDGEYQTGDWTLASALTIAEAQATFDEVLLANRFRPESGSAVNPMTANLYTGEGNIGNFNMDLSSTPEFSDVGNINWPSPNVTMGSNSSISESGGRRQFGITGTYENIDRESNSFEFSAEKLLDGVISSVKFGYRYSNETADSQRYQNSTTGVDMSQVTFNNDTLQAPAYATGGGYFGGEAPGFLTAEGGWTSFAPGPMIEQLIATIPPLSDIAVDPQSGEVPFLTHRGFIQRGDRLTEGLNYSTDIDNHAAFAMATFDLELGNMPVTGNFGLRYVQSDVAGSAPLYDLDDVTNPDTLTTKHDYNYLLPSINTSVELREDLVLRLAYNEGIVRPNLRNAKPAATLKINGDFSGEQQSAAVTLPGVQVDPFEAKNYDASLEWYNREGSAVTLAIFRKDISNFINEGITCSNAAVAQAGFTNLVGQVSLVDDLCVTSGVAGSLQAGAEVDITQVQNLANDITVDGIEISVQQNLDFLPAPWDGLGGILNYSYTSQSSDAENDVKVTGISDDTFNAIAYFEQDNYGLRLSYNYRSDYELESVGTFNGAGDKSVKAAGRLDFSAYYKISKQTKINFKGYNLTESLYEEYESVEWQPRATHFDGRTFVVSIQHSFF